MRDSLQQYQVLATYQAGKRKKDGPIVAEPDSLRGHGLYVAYGINSRGQHFAAIFRDGRRLTNWART